MIYVTVLLSLIGAQFVTFMIARTLKNPGVVDLTWVLCLTFFPLCLIWGRDTTPDPLLSWVLSVLIVLWGLRLGGHIFLSRVLPGHVDLRYLDVLPKKSPQDWFYFWNFQFQGLLISVILLPFYDLPATVPYRWLFILGGICALLGLNIEMQADQQLEDFKKDNSQQVCTKGLWQYSRHPNYYGEFLFWLGIALCTFQDLAHHWIFLSPVCLLLIFYFITGPITETGSIQRRGFRYVQYQQQVPFLFPVNWRFWAAVLLFDPIKKHFTR